MFRCEICGQVSKPGEKPVKIIVKRRAKVYPPDVSRNDNGGVGWEIAKEVSCHAGTTSMDAFHGVCSHYL